MRRLRIYPHALRTDNAYYSPDKKALLFGYFPSASKDDDATAPGSMVFSCLSSDIIAHEMSHALLDGLHRRFQEASNPDVPAFHEAFADIVALFQHFTVTELVRFEIARARGDLSAAQLLGGLAKQFGEGVGRGGPLRNYLDPAMPTLDYADTQEVHDRGSILVFAVYEAFLNIVARRTGDLIRLATGGTGILARGRAASRPRRPADRRDLQGRGPRPPHLHPRARLLPGGRHHLRRISARADHRRHRPRARRSARLPRRLHGGLPQPRHPAPGRAHDLGGIARLGHAPGARRPLAAEAS